MVGRDGGGISVCELGDAIFKPSLFYTKCYIYFSIE
jgi:hypothetical protein